MKFDYAQNVVVEGHGVATIIGYDGQTYTVITTEGHQIKGVKEDKMHVNEYNYREVFFVNEDHKKNFARTLQKWPQAVKDTEYQQACYVFSVPMIFRKVTKRFPLEGMKKPVNWIWHYLQWDKDYKEEWENYSRYRDDDRQHPDYEAWMKKKPYDLTSSMKQLGKFSLNLWNSSNESNLMDCIASLDDNNIEVLKCALDMRLGKFRGRV